MRRYLQIAFFVLSLSIAVAGCRDKTSGSKGSVGASSAGAEAPRIPVRFVVEPWRIGEKYRVQHTSRLKVSVEFWAENERWGTSESSRTEEVAAHVEVLGLVGNSPAKVRVHYDHYRLEELKPNEPPRRDAVLEGHTYVADATSGPATVLDESQKPASDPEQDTVRTHFASLGKDDPIIEALRPYRLEISKTIILGEKLFRALLGSSEGNFKSGSFAVRPIEKEKAEQIAVIEWSAELQTQEDNGMITDWHIKGTTRIAVQPARVLKNDIRSDMDVSGKTKKDGVWVGMEGAGSMQDTYAITGD